MAPLPLFSPPEVHPHHLLEGEKIMYPLRRTHQVQLIQSAEIFPLHNLCNEFGLSEFGRADWVTSSLLHACQVIVRIHNRLDIPGQPLLIVTKIAYYCRQVSPLISTERQKIVDTVLETCKVFIRVVSHSVSLSNCSFRCWCCILQSR